MSKKRLSFLAGFAYTYDGLHSAVGSASDSRARGCGFDIWSGHIISFLLLLCPIQEGQLSVSTG